MKYYAKESWKQTKVNSDTHFNVILDIKNKNLTFD